MCLRTIMLFTLALIFSQCTEDRLDVYENIDQDLIEAIDTKSPTGNHSFYVLPSYLDLNSIPQDSKNPLSDDKVELGKHLFFETGIALNAEKQSGMGTYSCATCHIPEAGFKPGRFQGIADGGMGYGLNGEVRVMNDDYEENELDIQSARPLSLVNVAFVKNTFWNGQFGSEGANIGTDHIWDQREDTQRNHLGFEAIETQNIEGIGSHRFLVNKSLMDEFGYTELFDSSFPEYAPQFRYTNLTASLALSAYIRTIVSDEAPFQEWLKGNQDAMTPEEKQGALLFFGKANCISCHYNENLGSDEFHVLGTKDMDQHPDALNKKPEDRRNMGRGGFTMQSQDMYKFRVPGIYNSKDTPFYFHGGSKTSLREVIEYKIAAKRENERVPSNRLSLKLLEIELTATEIDNLVLFLEKSLQDNHLQRYKPDYIKSGLCYPNNDELSQIDLDCN